MHAPCILEAGSMVVLVHVSYSSTHSNTLACTMHVLSLNSWSSTVFVLEFVLELVLELVLEFLYGD